MSDLAKLHYAGHLVCQVRNPSGLQTILNEFFRLKVRIREFIGHWLLLPENGRCHLGQSPATGTLGTSCIVGARVWDCQSKFRIILGPLDLGDYLRFLPGGESLKRLVDWVRNYVGDSLAWDVNLVLKKAEVPKLELGKMGQLGWTTWLASYPHIEDADDLVLNPFISPPQPHQ